MKSEKRNPDREMTNRPPRRAIGVLSLPPTISEYPAVPIGRAFHHAVGMFTVAFGSYAFFSILYCAHLLGASVSPWWYGFHHQSISLMIGGIWLSAISSRDPDETSLSTGLMVVGMGFCALGLISFRETFPVTMAIPAAVWWVLYAVVCAWLCLQLAHERGVSPRQLGLAPGWAKGFTGWSQALVVAIVAFSALCAATWSEDWALANLHWLPHGQILDVIRAPRGFTPAVQILAAGVAEETMLVAGLVSALEAAQRRGWQIYAIGLVMRVSFHLGLGPVGLVSVIFAATDLCLYRRTRRLTPLIVAHVALDAYARYGGRFASGVIHQIGPVAMICLPIAALALGTTHLLTNRRPVTGAA